MVFLPVKLRMITPIRQSIFISGAYGMIGSVKAVQTAIEILKPFRQHDPLCFRTEKSFHCLKYLPSRDVIW